MDDEFKASLMDHVNSIASMPREEMPQDVLGYVSRQTHPELSILDTDFSKEALVTAIRSMGKPKLADELQQQDCTQLLDWYKFVGYGTNTPLINSHTAGNGLN